MESSNTDAVSKSERTVISLSPSTLFVQLADRQIQIPSTSIIAVRVTDCDKITGSQSRVKAEVWAVGDLCRDDSKEVDVQGNAYELKNFEIEYDQEDGIPLWPISLRQLPDHLLLPSTDGQANVHVIISTLSGTQRAASFFEQALRPLLDQLVTTSYEVHRTESPDTISQFTRHVILPRSKQGTKQLIILLSGDGGMVDVANALRSEGMTADGAAVAKPIVALIPMGTGNALFNSSCRRRPALASASAGERDGAQPASISYPDNTLGLRTLILGSPQPLPTFSATFSPGSAAVFSSSSSTHKPFEPPAPSTSSVLHGCVLLSWCLHASLVSLSDTLQHRQKGTARFAAAAQSLLYPGDGSPTHLYRGVVSTLHFSPDHNKNGGGGGDDDDSNNNNNGRRAEVWRPIRESDGTVRKLHTYILATMVSNLEDRFTISPASEPLDRRLRLVSIGAVGAEELVRLLGLAYQGGKHVEDALVRYEEVEGLRIEFDEEDVDDECAADDADDEGQRNWNSKGKWRRVCVDGSIVECPKGGWVEVRKNPRASEVVDLVVL